MKILAVTLKVKKEKIEDAKAFLKTFVEPSQSEAGCVQYELFQGEEDKQIFYFFEKWKDQAAYDSHSKQPFLQDLKERFDELLEEPTKVLWLSKI